MSRAFVSESDHDETEELPPLRSPLPAGARNYMTARGAEALQKEIDKLALVERPRISSLVAAARGSGNEADRGALRAAQHELAVIDRQLAYLGELMRTCEVVAAGSGPADRVSFGSTVRVRDRESGLEERYQIVGVYESDPDRGLISWVSPIARALKGAVMGETAEVPLPDGPRILKVIEIVR